MEPQLSMWPIFRIAAQQNEFAGFDDTARQIQDDPHFSCSSSRLGMAALPRNHEKDCKLLSCREPSAWEGPYFSEEATDQNQKQNSRI